MAVAGGILNQKEWARLHGVVAAEEAIIKKKKFIKINNKLLKIGRFCAARRSKIKKILNRYNKKKTIPGMTKKAIQMSRKKKKRRRFKQYITVCPEQTVVGVSNISKNIANAASMWVSLNVAGGIFCDSFVSLSFLCLGRLAKHERYSSGRNLLLLQKITDVLYLTEYLKRANLSRKTQEEQLYKKNKLLHEKLAHKNWLSPWNWLFLTKKKRRRFIKKIFFFCIYPRYWQKLAFSVKGALAFTECLDNLLRKKKKSRRRKSRQLRFRKKKKKTLLRKSWAVPRKWRLIKKIGKARRRLKNWEASLVPQTRACYKKTRDAKKRVFALVGRFRKRKHEILTKVDNLYRIKKVKNKIMIFKKSQGNKKKILVNFLKRCENFQQVCTNASRKSWGLGFEILKKKRKKFKAISLRKNILYPGKSWGYFWKKKLWLSKHRWVNTYNAWRYRDLKKCKHIVKLSSPGGKKRRWVKKKLKFFYKKKNKSGYYRKKWPRKLITRKRKNVAK